jgi:hypothetical protein
MVEQCPYYASKQKCEVSGDLCERAHCRARDFKDCYLYQNAKDAMKLIEA